ncbi:hypothetical protein S83_035021, partial [Arachis hypogaea]
KRNEKTEALNSAIFFKFTLSRLHRQIKPCDGEPQFAVKDQAGGIFGKFFVAREG